MMAKGSPDFEEQ